MNRITIDTEDLRGVARVFESESEQLTGIRLDLLRAWSDIPLGAYPGVERLVGWADDITGRVWNLAGMVSNDAAGAQLQALRAEESELLGRFVSVLLGGFGLLFATAVGQPLATWLPAVAGTGAAPGTIPVDALGGVAPMPILATGVGTLDPLAALGAQNGALAPISGLLGQVQQVVNNPIGFLGGPQGQALAANNGALAPIQGLLNQTQAVVDNPLGFAGLPASAGGSSLASLENAALQQNVNRILSGGSFPGSDFTSSFANSVHNLFPGGVNNFLNSTVAAAKADGTFHPGINATAALEGQLAAREQFSNAASSFNPFRSIIDDNISRSNEISFMNQLNAQSTLNSGENLLASVNSQFGFNF